MSTPKHPEGQQEFCQEDGWDASPALSHLDGIMNCCGTTANTK